MRPYIPGPYKRIALYNLNYDYSVDKLKVFQGIKNIPKFNNIILVTLLSGVTHVTSKREGVFSARNAIPEDETVVRVAQSRRPLTNDAAWLGN